MSYTPSELQSLLDNSVSPSSGQEGIPVGGKYSFVTWSFFGIRPEANLYIYPDSYLFVDVSNSFQNLSLHLSLQVLQSNGSVKEFLFTVTPPATRVVTSFLFFVGEGFLLSLNAKATNAGVRRGQCFVRAGIARNVGTDTVRWRTLISDYVESNYEIGWPAGVLRSQLDGRGLVRVVSGTLPGAGVDLSETVPNGTFWRLVAWRVRLQTSPAAVSRSVRVVIDTDTTNDVVVLPLSVFVGQSRTLSLNLVTEMGTDQFEDQFEIRVPLPLIHLRSGWKIRTVTNNMQAGDQWVINHMLVEEHIDAL